jgi:hypothetical protein
MVNNSGFNLRGFSLGSRGFWDERFYDESKSAALTSSTMHFTATSACAGWGSGFWVKVEGWVRVQDSGFRV